MDAEKIRQIATIHAKSLALELWAWAGAAFILSIIVFVLVGKIFYAGKQITQAAVFDGQRVVIQVSNGETLEGNPRHTRRAETAKPAVADTSASKTVISKENLAPAPLAAITEQSDKGIIPVAAHDGTLAWKYYARPYVAKEKRPVVAVLVTGLGLSKRQTQDVLKLPHNFTLSFSPYASDTRTWANEAREEGFETLVDIPVEPANFPISDPGPYGLVETLDPNEARARMHWVLSRFAGYVGVLAAPADEKLTANTGAIRNILTELSARGVLFFYVKNAKNIGLVDLAKSRSLLLAGVDVVLDEEGGTPALEQQLRTLTDLAKKQGVAIGIAHSYPTTTQALIDWAEQLQSEGVDLVPASAAAARELP